MHNYKELNAWKKAMDISVKIYCLTSNFPNNEQFGIISQMRRCSVSVASNIAEGAGRGTNNDFKRFLSIALGSLFELETQILLSIRLNYMSNDEILLSEINHLENMIFKLKQSLTS